MLPHIKSGRASAYLHVVWSHKPDLTQIIILPNSNLGRASGRSQGFMELLRRFEAKLIIPPNNNLGRAFGGPQGFVRSLSCFEAKLIILPDNNLGRASSRS